MIKNLLLVTCVSIVLSGCIGGEKEEKWTSFIYPDKENTKRSLKSPVTFNTLQECKDETIKQMTSQNLMEVGIFKCGLNCKFHEGMKVEVCEKMLTLQEK